MLAETATKRADISDSLVFSRMREHGVAIVELDADKAKVTFHNVPAQLLGEVTAKVNYYTRPQTYLAKVNKYTFEVDHVSQTLSASR